MKATEEFLSHLYSLDIKLRVSDDRLRCNAPKGTLTPALRAELAERKAEIIAFLREADDAAPSISPPIRPISRDGELPLSFAQQRLWFLDQLVPGNPFYNVSAAVRMTGRLNVTALAQSLNGIVQRHETLRTTFATADGQPFQVIVTALTLPLPMVDLREIPGMEREAEARRLAMGDEQRPFDLARGPLLRTTLLQMEAEEHVLLLTMHHVVSDGWSLGVLIREIAALYQAFSTGEPSPLPELPIQYADFAVWQREWLQGKVLDAQLSYWKRQLAGAPAVLEMPADRPRPPVQTYRGAQQAFALPRSLTEALKRLSQQEECTLFMMLLAAFKALVYRYTGHEDIVVGSPIANRTRAEIEGLIGFFVNTLVLRTDLGGNPSFRELLGRVREVALGAYAHQDLPFEKLVEELQPERDMSRNPLFQIMFVFQNAPMAPLELWGLTLSMLEFARGVARVDLEFHLWEVPEGLDGFVLYNTDLFEAGTIARMLSHFQTLLEDIVADPERRILDSQLLTDAERHQLLVEWNDTETEYPQDKCIHELFEAQVERTLDAVAVVFKDQQLTYRELNRRANQLAHHLQALDVGPDVPVAISMKRSLDMAVGVLGILKAGGVYIPLDPIYPQERLAFMLQDAQSPVLLTQHQLLDNLPEYKRHIVCLDTGWQTIEHMPQVTPPRVVTPDNLAYIIYTSGSTGRPKGVAMRHRPLTNLMHWQGHATALSQPARTLQFASLSFDASCHEVFFTWSSGGTLVLISEDTQRDAVALLKVLNEASIERLFLPFVALQHMAQVVADQDAVVPAKLREVMTAGEQLQITPQIESLFNELDGCALHNQYGPTEGHVVTAFTLGETPETWAALPPIGCPIANATIYILDQCLQPVPIGVPGELHIGGLVLARGYLGRPDLTAERFIPDPFSREPGAQLYKTGDLACYRPDGNIEFLGRIDHQVKVRGFRVELGEIEAVLGQHPAVQGTVVVAREDAPGDKRLVAYVVPDPDQVTGTSELRRFLQAKLPNYMVPSAFMMLEALPLTPSGKVNRRALPAPERGRPEMEGDLVAPSTPVEEMLAGIWAGILGLERVGVHDNFFELGGHSLLGTQVISRVRKAFQVELPLRKLFEMPTVAGLSERIEMARRSEQGLSAPPIVPVARDGELWLSFAQQRLWFLDRLRPGSAAYNMPAALHVTGRVDMTMLQQSLDEVVRRHKMLRTTFAAVEGRPVQVIAPALTLPPLVFGPRDQRLPIVDLRELSETEREAETRRLTSEEAQQPFDLAQGPLLRMVLLRLDEEEHVLLMTMHHIISDGWSVGVLVQEIATLYQAFTTGEPSPLPELSIQYTDFAVWQREWLQGEVLEKQLGYWKQQLAGAPTALELPTDRPRPPLQGYHGACQYFVLPRSLAEELKALSQREGGTLFMTLLAAFKTLLYRYTGQEDILVGSPIANRNRAEIEELIGFFVNTLVLRTELGGNPSFRELLGQVREVTLGAYAHQDLPFEMLVDELQPERNLSHSPLFQVMFVLQNMPMQPLTLPGLTLTPLNTDSGTAKFDLTLFMVETDRGLRGTVEYNTGLFDATTISRMMGHFQTLLKSIVADPEQRICDLPLLPEAEQHQLLVEWNDTEMDYPQDRCIHELFEAQVERTPDAVAVVFPSTGPWPSGHGKDRHLTYRELNRRANQLAHHLRGLGVGPEVRAGICAERSLEMVIGLYGILKAGGAYVPLDPTYPPARLAFMTADAQVPVLLTQERLVSMLPAHGAQAYPEPFVPGPKPLVLRPKDAGDQGPSRRVICLDTDWEAIAQQDTQNPVSVVAANNLAYVIYTSGSTGKPKGAMNTHTGIRNRLLWMQEAYQLAETDRVMQKTPFSFDVSVWEFFWPLLTGACLVVARPEGHKDSAYLVRTIVEQGITTMHFVPSMLQVFVEEGGVEGCSSLKRVICSGEALPFNLQERFFARLGAELHNLYGPTEAAVDVTFWPCEREGKRRTVPIGRPIANTQIYLLDAHLEPVPVGVSGELHIGGVGLARGYHNRHDLTAEKFIPDPFIAEPGARLYKTGDLARYLPDGNIEFQRRIDHQVKVRGFRIELGEIEATLGQHPAVRETVVLAREDEPGDLSSPLRAGKRLAAYVVPSDGQEPAVGELRHFLQERLPEYMVPSAFVTLEALPLTPNGKVDRRALPAPDGTRPELETAYVSPRSEAERTIAAIWEEVLRVEQVGVNDNFFDLGGHSLLVVQVHSRLMGTFKREFPMTDMFRHTTVAGLAQYLSQVQEQADTVQKTKERAAARRASLRRRARGR